MCELMHEFMIKCAPYSDVLCEIDLTIIIIGHFLFNLRTKVK